MLSDKSNENWNDGLDALKNEKCNLAANRLYYAVFQAVLLVARNNGYTETQKSVHSDMIKRVRDSSGRGGVFFSRRLQLLHGYRLTADYELDTPSKTDIENVLDDCSIIREHHLKSR